MTIDSNTPVLIDEISSKVSQYWSDNYSELHEIAVNAGSANWKNTIWNRFQGHTTFISNEVERAILEYQDELLAEFAAIASKHSPYFWLMVDARVPHSDFHSRNFNTVALYRHVLRCGIWKYSSLQMVDVEIRQDNFFPTKFELADAKMYTTLEKLAFEIYMTTCDLRRLWKGGVFRLYDQGHSFEHDRETEEAIKWYDERNSRVGSFISATGLFVPSERSSGNDETKLADPLISIFPNFKHEKKFSELPYKKMFDLEIENENWFATNYIVLPYEVNKLFEYLRPFESEIQNFVNVDLKELCQILSIWGFRQMRLFKRNPKALLHILQRAYIVTGSLDFLAEDIAGIWEEFSSDIEIYKSDLDIQAKTAKVRLVLEKLSSDAELLQKPDAVSVPNRIGLPLLVKLSSEKTIVDFRNLDFTATDLLDKVVRHYRSGSFSDKIGNTFPFCAMEFIKRALPNLRVAWHPNKVLRLNNEERDIDLSFVSEDILFVVECKVKQMDFDYLIGRERDVVAGWKESKRKLTQAKDTADLLARHHKKFLDGELSKIRYLYPLVFFPTVRWIKRKKSPYLVAGKYPRFMTPEEFVLMMAELDLAQVRCDPETIKLND